MFKLTSEPRFTHEVKVQVPVDGGFVEQSFKTTFRVLPIDQLKEDYADEEASQAEHLRKLIVSIADLVDENDQPVPYSDAVRDQLLGVPYVRIALMQTYIKAVTRVKTGN